MSEYLNADEIANDVFGKFTMQARYEAASFSKEDLIQFHHGTGREIRNQYGLWETDNPYTDASDPMGPLHPDQYSTAVMEKIHTLCCEWVREHAPL